MANGDRLTYTDALKEVRGGLTALGDKLGTVGEDVATLTERSQNTNRRLDSIEKKINTICETREKDREVVDKLADRVHDIEGGDMFPRIEAAGGGMFREVIAKLKAEHEVVHELIIRLDRAADALIDDPSAANFALAAATFRKLEEVVRSHFGYEETELAEAIGYYLGAI